MMGILRTILFAATGLAATGAAFAQQTDSASLFRTQREHASPVAALAATAYATPALRSEAFAGSLSEISVGYEMRREEKALEQQKGDGGDFGRFSAGSYKHISGKGTVWGDAGYLRGAKRNVVWNASSDYDLVFPYVVADSIGGDLTSEEYTFGGGYGHRSGRYTWALEAGARALHEYRDSDPRIRNVAIDIDAGAALPCGWGTTAWGFRPHSASTSNRVPRYSTPIPPGRRASTTSRASGRITPGSRAMRTPRPDTVAAATG